MGETSLLEMAYVAGVLLFIAIRRPHQRRWKSNEFRDNRLNGIERMLLAAVFLAMMALPLLWLTTPWLSFADYRLPAWAGAAGMAMFAFAAWLFWRSHRDLGANWSPSLQVREGHELITSGIYAHVRHPMYAAIWLWALAQPLLIQNWIVGPAALLAFGAMYARRREAEETMMINQFGETYRAYAARTPRLMPRFFERGR